MNSSEGVTTIVKVRASATDTKHEPGTHARLFLKKRTMALSVVVCDAEVHDQCSREPPNKGKSVGASDVCLGDTLVGRNPKNGHAKW